MTERKPANLSWEGFAEQQIRTAQEAGEFDHLPGAGRPIPGDALPLEENWWLKRKLKEENASLLPPLLEARRDIERTRQEILACRSESLARAELEKLKERVWKLLTSPLPSPPVVVLPIDVEEELARWRRR